MRILLTIFNLVLYLEPITCWTYSQYFTVTVIPDPVFGMKSATTTTLTVSPTGSAALSPTSTNINTTTKAIALGDFDIPINITVTELYLGSNAPVCTHTVFEMCCFSITNPCTTPDAYLTYTAGGSIATSVWVPVTISNPPTCTKTSFTYTTSAIGWFEPEQGQADFQYPTIFAQAVETGSEGEALFITTYVSTISIDLGGQAITTTRCDIWLKTDAVGSMSAMGLEQGYLDECVDPRLYLCDPNNESSATCDTNWVGTYPETKVITSWPSGVTPTSGITTPPTASGNSLPTTSHTTKTGGAARINNIISGTLMLMILTATTYLLLL